MSYFTYCSSTVVVRLLFSFKHMALQSDLNEKEDQLLIYKRREEEFKVVLDKKKKDLEDDAKIKVQLSKKLQELLMDKEDMRDEILKLKVSIKYVMFVKV
jgi:hypothetical protein